MEAIGLTPSSADKPGGKEAGEETASYAIKDGPFMQAIDVLLATGLRISWFGRHPPAGGETAAVFGDAGSGDDDESGGMAGLLELVTPGNKSNRGKYHCPMCIAQVWGKLSLKLMCGGDDRNGTVFELATSQERQQ